MNSGRKKSLDDLKKEAEIRRIEAETHRIELEKAELERKLNLPWFRRQAFLQAIVAGIVAIPLIWFFIGNIVIPSLNKDNIKLAWENEVKADSLRRAKKQFQKRIDSLAIAKKVEAEKMLAELEDLKTQYVKIDSTRKALAAEYRNVLNQLNLSKQQRSDLEKQVSLLQEAASQKQKLESLNSQIARQKESIYLLNATLIDTLFIPVYLSEEQAKEMIRRNGYYDKYKNPNGKGIDNQFSLQKSGQIVFDAATGLTWQQSGSSFYATYQNAKKYIDQLNRKQFAGFSDWRLPTLKEAMSLMRPTYYGNLELYIDSIFDLTQRYIWTSDLYSASKAWSVDFSYGGCYHDPVGVGDVSVRAVRSL